MAHRRWLVFAWVLLSAVALAACGGGAAAPPPAEGGATGGGAAGQITPVATLGAVGVEGKLYLGQLVSPQSGPVALYIHLDGSAEMIVANDDLQGSLYFDGMLEGQRINLQSEIGTTRALGRYEEGRIDLNITLPGQGTFRAVVDESAEAGLYLGTLNDLAAGLIILPDGTARGFAAVEGGEEPVYEALCVEGGESLPPEIIATTCDTGEEVTLTLATD